MTLTQLALAWTAYNPHSSSMILGASKKEQLEDNLKALDVLAKMDKTTYKKINEILGEGPKHEVGS
jgi:aryl-alcohol dehydrogenase-like predicted oxidoreductase